MAIDHQLLKALRVETPLNREVELAAIVRRPIRSRDLAGGPPQDDPHQRRATIFSHA
jgi:hypothetical protein